jgi:hypothetical protein
LRASQPPCSHDGRRGHSTSLEMRIRRARPAVKVGSANRRRRTGLFAAHARPPSGGASATLACAVSRARQRPRRRPPGRAPRAPRSTGLSYGRPASQLGAQADRARPHAKPPTHEGRDRALPKRDVAREIFTLCRAADASRATAATHKATSTTDPLASSRGALGRAAPVGERRSHRPAASSRVHDPGATVCLPDVHPKTALACRSLWLGWRFRRRADERRGDGMVDLPARVRRRTLKTRTARWATQVSPWHH